MYIHHILVMGVSGCGKSTIARLLAEQINAEYIDADDYHPPANVKKMARGEGLNDQDRLPWLTHLNQLLISRLETQQPVVLACSALKSCYRETLRANLNCQLKIVWLHGTDELLRQRLEQRIGHFATTTLLQSQLDTLEPPDVSYFDISTPVESLLNQISTSLIHT